jgi:pimeloyl-ACP methyl ester carboxylesterase
LATILLAHGAWSAAWAWKKMRPLMVTSGHVFVTPTYTGLGEHANLASPSVDLDTHIDDILRVLHYEDLHDVALLGHSYGGMVATGVADRAASRIAHVIYLDAFVPTHGQSLSDLVSAEQRENTRVNVANGDGWRVPPNPSPEDTSPEDLAWIAERRILQPVKCFEQPLMLQHGDLSLPRSYIRATRNAGGPFGKFADRARSEPGWRYYEIDASHSPNVTAPEALMKVLNVVIAERDHRA